MNRQTQREIQRLNKLADYIEANPDKYKQREANNCVVGLMATQVAPQQYKKEGMLFYDDFFAKYCGISEDAAGFINGGIWDDIDNQFPRDNQTAEDAVKLLRWIVGQKALDKRL